MIRIQRGKEPRKLTILRRRELPRLRAALHANRNVPVDIPDSYVLVKEDLWRGQHMKCGYCELIQQLKHNDVDHFRPKSRAERQPGSSRTHGYWWLSWTWENLLFACAPCNRDHKRFQFPLEVGSRVLGQGKAPPSGERPLLVDPSAEDPLLHIQFRPYFRFGKQYWRPWPRAGSQRGVTTLRVLGLGRPDLIDLYKRHVDRHVLPEVTGFRKLMKGTDKRRVAQAWRELTRRLLDVREPLTALSYDALDHLVPAADRVRWGLSLPLPR